MSKTIKKGLNIFTSILVVLVLVLAVLLAGVRLLGYQVYAVLSGSMEPAYHVGALIYVKPAQEIQPGDPITYRLSGDTIATHRVVEVLEEDGSTFYRTKGDANEDVDGRPVPAADVIGVPRFTIPYLGYVADFIQHPPGSYLAMAGGAVLLLLIFLPDLLGPEEPKQGKFLRRSQSEAQSDR